MEEEAISLKLKYRSTNQNLFYGSPQGPYTQNVISAVFFQMTEDLWTTRGLGLLVLLPHSVKIHLKLYCHSSRSWFCTCSSTSTDSTKPESYNTIVCIYQKEIFLQGVLGSSNPCCSRFDCMPCLSIEKPTGIISCIKSFQNRSTWLHSFPYAKNSLYFGIFLSFYLSCASAHRSAYIQVHTRAHTQLCSYTASRSTKRVALHMICDMI